MNMPDVSNGWQFAALVVVVAFQAYQIWMQRKLNSQQIENHLAMNSRLSQLIESTKLASHAAGMAEATATERATAREFLPREQKDIPHSIDVNIHADPPRTSPGIQPLEPQA